MELPSQGGTGSQQTNQSLAQGTGRGSDSAGSSFTVLQAGNLGSNFSLLLRQCLAPQSCVLMPSLSPHSLPTAGIAGVIHDFRKLLRWWSYDPEGSWLHGVLSCFGERGRWSTDDLRLVIGLLLVNRYLITTMSGHWAWPWETVVSKFLPWMPIFQGRGVGT